MSERYDRHARGEAITEEAARAAAARLLPGLSLTAIRRLSGGFQNANFAVECASEKFVLRHLSGGAEVAAREARVLALARAAGVRVPEPIAVDGAWSAQRFVRGTPLAGVTSYASLGAELAKVHQIRFPEEGTFQPDGTVRPLPAGGGLFFLRQFLDGRAGERLGAERAAAVRSLTEAEWGLVTSTSAGPALVHCDFNPKNVLIGADGEVAAILDWEFAIAAHPLIDLGNFFRFPDDYGPREREAFLRAYAREGGVLPPTWQKAARLLDLVSLCAFLAVPEEYPRTFATAKDRIDDTLRALNAADRTALSPPG